MVGSLRRKGGVKRKSQASSIESEGEPLTTTDNLSIASDLYARESEQLLEKHLSLALSDSAGLPDTITNNHLSIGQYDDSKPPSVCSDDAPSSVEVLRTINEDLNRIRHSMKKKALQSEDSIEIEKITPRPVEMTIPSGLCSPTENFDQMICYDDEDDGNEIEMREPDKLVNNMTDSTGTDSHGTSPNLREAGPLPKRSICVDSGRIMDEEEFCQPSPSSEDYKGIALKFNHQKDLSQSHDPNKGMKAPLERSLSVSFDNELSIYNSDVEDDSRDEIMITKQQLKEDTDLSMSGESSSEIRVGDRATELLNDQPIEPLLRSKNIPLRKKLQCLASLYSSDDMEQTELQYTPLTPPYNINMNVR